MSKILNVPKAKKHSKYIPLDMEQLQSGETYEIPEVYIGIYQKLPARLILYNEI